MKYAVLKVANGNFAVHTEWSDLTKAKVNYHELCKTFWNAPDVITGKIMLVDEQLNCVDGYSEFVTHEPEPEPEPEETQGNEEELPQEETPSSEGVEEGA